MKLKPGLVTSRALGMGSEKYVFEVKSDGLSQRSLGLASLAAASVRGR